jgi:STE24 endopeptidase
MVLPVPQDHPDTPEARRYNRVRRILGVADAALGVVALLVLLITHWSAALRDLSFRAWPQNYSLALLLYWLMLAVLLKLAGFPLDVYGYRLERHYDLSNQKTGAWLWDEFKGWLVGFAIGLGLVELVYYVMRKAPNYWWLITWALFIVIYVSFVQLAPLLLFPLFYKFKPLENDALRERLTRLGERAGTRVRGVYEWVLSEKSKKANAALTGLGATRRIILADTLLRNYSDDEIEAVLAHELGHHIHRHIFKSIVVQAGVSLFGFWAANEVLHRAVDHHLFDFVYDFANLPLLLLVSSAISLLLLIPLNAYSRYNERQADTYAFQSVRDVRPYIAALNKLADQNMAERQPSRLVEVLFHSHPPIPKRIAAAEAWARKNPPLMDADQR